MVGSNVSGPAWGSMRTDRCTAANAAPNGVRAKPAAWVSVRSRGPSASDAGNVAPRHATASTSRSVLVVTASPAIVGSVVVVRLVSSARPPAMTATANPATAIRISMRGVSDRDASISGRSWPAVGCGGGGVWGSARPGSSWSVKSKSARSDIGSWWCMAWYSTASEGV